MPRQRLQHLLQTIALLLPDVPRSPTSHRRRSLVCAVDGVTAETFESLPDVPRTLRLAVEQTVQPFLLEFRQPPLLAELLEDDSSVLKVDRLCDDLLAVLSLQLNNQLVRQPRIHRFQDGAQLLEVLVFPVLL